MGLIPVHSDAFGLKNAPPIFSRVVIAVFKEFIHKFLEVYFDDWTIFGLMNKHVGALRLMLVKCWEHQISLNLKNVYSVYLPVFFGTCGVQTRTNGGPR